MQYYIEYGRILDFVYIYQPNHFRPSAGKLRFVVPNAIEPKTRHTSKCTDCIATIPEVLPICLGDNSTCKCGAVDHCIASKKCVLWKNRDLPTTQVVDRIPLEVPEQIECNEVFGNIENLYDDDCLCWCIRYQALVEKLARNCPCGKDSCIWQQIAGHYIPLGRKKTVLHSSIPNYSKPRGGIEMDSAPPRNTWTKTGDMPAGKYICKKWVVAKHKNKNRLLFVLSNEEHKEVPVYGYYLEEAVREMAGIERLRAHGTTFVCRLGELCTSPISRNTNDNREVEIDLHNKE